MGEDSYIDQYLEDQYEIPSYFDGYEDDWYNDIYELDDSWVDTLLSEDDPPEGDYDLEYDDLDDA